MRIGILTSHPIQYQAPLFRALAKVADLHVYFAHRATAKNQAEAGFSTGFEWDTDLLSGFSSEFLRNVSAHPNVVSFSGCDTPDIGEHLSNDKIDILIVYGWNLKCYVQGVVAARKRRIPVLARTDSTLMAPRHPLTRFAKRLTYPFLLRQFDGFLASGAHAASYLASYGVPPEKTHIVPYCVDIPYFESCATIARTSRQTIRAKWGAGERTNVLLFVGKMIPQKSIFDLLDALKILVNRNIITRGVIVGDGPLEAEIRAYVGKHALPVHFAGFVNQSRIAEYYVGADVLVLPSNSETWGFVVNEAYACRLPVVVSDRVGCAPELVLNRPTGRVVRVHDAPEIANAVSFLLDKQSRIDTGPVFDDLNRHFSPGASARCIIEAVLKTRICAQQ